MVYIKEMNDFLIRIFELLHLPIIPADTIFGKIGFYAEAVFVIASFLLILNILLKYPRREEVFTTWTTFLLIVIPTSLVIWAIVWFIPKKVEKAWGLTKTPYVALSFLQASPGLKNGQKLLRNAVKFSSLRVDKLPGFSFG